MTHGDSHYFTTFSGRRVWPLDPRAEDIAIEDIAHALSMICRFTGHLRAFYSVAQHSVLVSRSVPREFALYGLLHDAAEAYVGDLSTELKHSPLLEGYRQAERHLQQVIYTRFGLEPLQEPPHVKAVDRALLQDEVRQLALHAHVRQPYCVGPGLGVEIDPWPPGVSEQQFLHAFHECQQLAGQR